MKLLAKIKALFKGDEKHFSHKNMFIYLFSIPLNAAPGLTISDVNVEARRVCYNLIIYEIKFFFFSCPNEL